MTSRRGFLASFFAPQGIRVFSTDQRHPIQDKPERYVEIVCRCPMGHEVLEYVRRDAVDAAEAYARKEDVCHLCVEADLKMRFPGPRFAYIGEVRLDQLQKQVEKGRYLGGNLSLEP